MKNYFHIAIMLVAFTTKSHAQSFEGKLTYQVELAVSEKLKEMGVSKEMIISKLKADGAWGDTVVRQYKNGHYREDFAGSATGWKIYNPDSNMLFSFEGNEIGEICIAKDMGIDLEQKLTGSFPSVQKLDSTFVYNELSLAIVEVKWKTGTYHYLFKEDSLLTDPALFKGHIYDGFYEYLKISHALPIIISQEMPGVGVVTFSLIKAETTTVSESNFELPALALDSELNEFSRFGEIYYRIKEQSLNNK